MFFTFNQNNSAGRFETDFKAGISHYVIVEADTADEANDFAHRIGLYFDGVSNGSDCGCCGDRWSEQDSDTHGTEVPSIYSSAIDFAEPKSTKFGQGMCSAWIKNGPEGFVHYKDGRIVPFENTKTDKPEVNKTPKAASGSKRKTVRKKKS